MQGNPCYARLFADLTRTPQGAFSCPFGTIHLVSPNPIKASGGQSRAPPVAGGARRKPSEQGSARKAPRADAARPLRTALRPPNPRGFFDSQRSPFQGLLRLSKKWLAPLFRGVHSSLAPTARPGSYARKPLLRKAFCGFDAHVAKSDQSLRGLRPPNPRGFFDRLRRGGPLGRPAAKRRRPP